jgi:hypothetical protein
MRGDTWRASSGSWLLRRSAATSLPGSSTSVASKTSSGFMGTCTGGWHEERLCARGRPPKTPFLASKSSRWVESVLTCSGASAAISNAPHPNSPMPRVVVNRAAMKPSITPGQRRVVEMLLGSERGRTYEGVARELGIGIGTVHTHLHRLRQRSPQLYREIMAVRRSQLEARHEIALINAAYHSQQWHRLQSARRYYRQVLGPRQVAEQLQHGLAGSE